MFCGTVFEKMGDVLVVETILEREEPTFEFVFVFDGDVVGTITWIIPQLGESEFEGIWGSGADLLAEYCDYITAR